MKRLFGFLMMAFLIGLAYSPPVEAAKNTNPMPAFDAVQADMAADVAIVADYVHMGSESHSTPQAVDLQDFKSMAQITCLLFYGSDLGLMAKTTVDDFVTALRLYDSDMSQVLQDITGIDNRHNLNHERYFKPKVLHRRTKFLIKA